MQHNAIQRKRNRRRSRRQTCASPLTIYLGAAAMAAAMAVARTPVLSPSNVASKDEYSEVHHNCSCWLALAAWRAWMAGLARRGRGWGCGRYRAGARAKAGAKPEPVPGSRQGPGTGVLGSRDPHHPGPMPSRQLRSAGITLTRQTSRFARPRCPGPAK